MRLSTVPASRNLNLGTGRIRRFDPHGIGFHVFSRIAAAVGATPDAKVEPQVGKVDGAAVWPRGLRKNGFAGTKRWRWRGRLGSMMKLSDVAVAADRVRNLGRRGSGSRTAAPCRNVLREDRGMPLIGPKEMFAAAYAGRYAVGAFNVNNMEIVQGIMRAAAQEKSPVILQVSAGARKYAGQVYIMKLVEAALAEEPSVPVVVHLDHGPTFEMCRDCIDGGFTSVMIDGSHLPYEENVALTKKVVEYAHGHGVWVEAELGKLAGVEEHVSSAEHVYTDPDQAVDFVTRTGCDSLAIAIGTSHGAYKFKGEARLDFDRLQTICEKLPDYPLVLHGASSVPQEFVEKCNAYGGKVGGAKGVPEDMLRRAAEMGVCKINVDTDIRLALTASIRECFKEHPDLFDPRGYLGPARDAVQAMVAHKIRDVMGSSGKM
jgi:fructose-bisphosphate aldolase class II